MQLTLTPIHFLPQAYGQGIQIQLPFYEAADEGVIF